MNRIDHLLESLASTAQKTALLATVFATFTLGSGNLFAAEICYGGSIVKNSSGAFIGCAFSSWGTAEQQMCNGATVFAGPDANNCHICVIPPYDQQVAKDDFTGLTLTPVGGGASNPPTDFKCLKCTPPPAGLTAWWTLDETNGTVHDFTGQLPMDGSRFGGATTVAGEVGNATQFNGVNQYIEIPNDPQLNVGPGAADGSGDFSIDAWLKIDAAANASGVRVIAEKRTFSAPSHYKGYSFYLYNRYLGFQLADDGTAPGYANFGAPALVVPADGQWHFVAVSVSRTSGVGVRFTLDNQPMIIVNSVAGTGSLSNSIPFRIGMRTIDKGGVFNGSIDEVEFFHRAVNSSEWQSIYSAKCYGKCRNTATQQGYLPQGCSYTVYSTEGNYVRWAPCNVSPL